MGKLHELLAVEGDKKGTSEKILKEGLTTFIKRSDHFTGHTKVLEYFDDVRNDKEGGVTERNEIVTTVGKKLEYIMGPVADYYNVTLQKETTNQKATADLVVDGETLGKSLPATFLLGLETKLKGVREVISAVPTLQPGISWIPDTDAGEGVFKREHPERTFKTERTIKPFELSPATKEHKAQVEKLSVDVNIGVFITDSSSSMLSPADKSKMLERVDKLIQAVKKARQRANNIDVEKAEIGGAITKYILG